MRCQNDSWKSAFNAFRASVSLGSDPQEWIIIDSELSEASSVYWRPVCLISASHPFVVQTRPISFVVSGKFVSIGCSFALLSLFCMSILYLWLVPSEETLETKISFITWCRCAYTEIIINVNIQKLTKYSNKWFLKYPYTHTVKKQPNSILLY